MIVTGLEVILPTNISLGIYVPQNPIGGLEAPTITKKRGTSKGTNIITYSGDLTFTGSDTEFIKQYLVEHASAIENFIVIHMDDECCGNTYTFLMQPDTIDWCYGECELTATPKEYSKDNEIFKCLDSKPIFDDTFASQVHPRIMFCKEVRPDWLQVVMLIAGIIFDSVLVTIIPLLIIIQVVVEVFAVTLFILTFGTIGTDIFIDTYFFDAYIHWVGEFQKSIVGCGYKTPSPLVREYIANGCSKCGATFESHIYTDPNSDYYNTVYFYNPTTPGLAIDDTNTYWMPENTPLQTTIQFIENQNEIFNADYSIKNGILRFERKDWFENLTPWLDLNGFDASKIIKECYSFTGDKKFAYASLKYSEDGFDQVGQEALNLHFSDIIEWNSPPSPMQSGVLDLQFPFGPNRYRQDGIGRDAGYTPALDTDILGGFEWFIGYQPAILASLDYLILSDGHTSLPKLLIWDEASGTQYGKVKKDWNTPSYNAPVIGQFPPIPAPPDGLHGIFAYNFPFWLREDASIGDAPAYPSCLQNSIYPGNLYNRFWYIENPRLSLKRQLNMDIEIVWDCDLLNLVDIDGTIRGRQYPNNATVEEIVIEYATHRMSIKGKL